MMENVGNQKLKLLKVTPQIHTFYFCQLFAPVYPKDTMVASHHFEVVTPFFQLLDTLAKNVLPKGRTNYIIFVVQIKTKMRGPCSKLLSISRCRQQILKPKAL